MTRLRARRRRRAEGDAGITIVEQVVTMSVLGLVIALVSSLIIATQRQTSVASLRLDDVDQARTALDAVSRAVRTAVEPAQLNLLCTACTGPASQSSAVVAARSTGVQLFANSGAAGGPLLVSFSVVYDATRQRADLLRTVQPADAGSAPNYTYSTCGTCATTSTLVRGVVWPLTAPVFRYYDLSGTELVPPTGGSLGTPGLVAVNAVGIHLPVRTPNPLLSSTSTVDALVALPNAGTGILASPTPLP